MKRMAEILEAKDLGAIIGTDWKGWYWAEGKIYAPEWREGLGPDDTRALPYLNSVAAEYRRANQHYETEMARMRHELEVNSRWRQKARRITENSCGLRPNWGACCNGLPVEETIRTVPCCKA
jgi:hypothetical protein